MSLGGAGDDEIKTGDGNDTIDSGADDDKVDGGNGFDTCANAEDSKSCSTNVSVPNPPHRPTPPRA